MEITYNQLNNFLARYSSLRKAAAKESVQSLDGEALKRFCAEFAGLSRLRRERGTDINIFEICRLGRDEIRNCSVLAWLLDGRGSHGLGSAFLVRLLETCGLSSVAQCARAATYAVRTEFCPDGDNANRVDIVCEGSELLIYIEVKIDSLEHSGQTDRYRVRLGQCAAGRKDALIFLSPGIPPANPGARFVTWRQCAAILGDLEAMAQARECVLPASMLAQYAAFIRKF